MQKDLENALPLAAPDQSAMTEERSFGNHVFKLQFLFPEIILCPYSYVYLLFCLVVVFAASYFQKVKERLDSGPLFCKFVELMDDLDRTHCVTDLYHRMINLLEGHPDLCEEFLLFLLPTQAIQCGKFMEHLALTEMSAFLRKLEV